jgi:hypothetical protein
LRDHTLIAVLQQQRVVTRGRKTQAGQCDSYTEPADHFYRALSPDGGKDLKPA